MDMMFSLHDVEYCAAECERQQTDWQGVIRMCRALRLARRISTNDTEGLWSWPTIEDVNRLVVLIEPEKNGYYESFYGWTNFRRVPVIVGGNTLGYDTIPEATIDLFDLIEGEAVIFPEDTDKFCKQLFDIHPWLDGNGRTVSILRNWLNDTLDEPEALPYYYGEYV